MDENVKKAIPMNNILIIICQNDSNGNLTDEAFMIDIEINGEIAARFETKDMMPRKCAVLSDRIIEFDNVIVKFSKSSDWVGNIHWNMYEMPPEYVLGLIQLFQLSKQWDCTEAWTTIFDKFKEGKTITGFDLDLDKNIEPVVLDKAQLQLFS